MNALLDRKSYQVAVHYGCLPSVPQLPDRRRRYHDAIERRLSDFQLALHEVGLSPLVSDGTDSQFSHLLEHAVSLVCVLSRLPKKPFSAAELDDLDAFVADGGALLLLSNHPPYCHVDSSLSKRFEVGLSGCFGSGGHDSGDYVRIPARLFGDHDIMSGLGADIVFNNCARVRPLSASSGLLAALPDGSSDAFAVVGSHGCGRYVVCGDSGFLGTASTTFPGPGLLDQGGNRDFLLRVVRWLTGQTAEG
jgi:hypothetical protein